MFIEDKLKELGYELPTAPAAVGFYVPVLRTGNLVVTSGQLSFVGKEIAYPGKVGDKVHEEDAQNAARIAVVNALAQIKACVGSLEKVKQIVRLEGYVHSAPGFQAQPHILNAASELLVQVFGEAGKHTRIALGIGHMPLNSPVQIALWAEVAD